MMQILAWGFSMWELLLIFGVILLVFGAKRVPELAKSLGRSVKEFKQGAREGTLQETDEAVRSPGCKDEIV